MHRRKLRSEDSLRPPLSFVKSSDNESAAQESKDPMPPHLSCFEPMPPSRYNHDGARGKFNKRSSASTSSAHPRRHYYGEPSDTIASLAAELAIARAELDAKDSELADMRAALEDKSKDFANVNKKLCDVKAEVGRLKANGHKHVKAGGRHQDRSSGKPGLGLVHAPKDTKDSVFKFAGKKHACSTCGNELCVDGLWYTSVETAAAPPHANRPPPQPKKRAHDHLQVCSKCRNSRADAAELQILFPRHEPYGTSVQLAALEKTRIAAALQVASDAHKQAQDEVALAAKLVENAADAEADAYAQADAALAQAAAEEKAAAAAAELLNSSSSCQGLQRRHASRP